MKLSANLSLLIAALAATAGAEWIQIPLGGLTHVSANINYLWGVNAANQIFMCPRPCTSSKWKQIDGALKQLDVDDQEVWGVNKANQIYKRPVDGSGKWQLIKGSLLYVSASGHGYIWGINNGGYIYKCKKPCSGGWVAVPGLLKQIDGGQEYVYGVNSANNVYMRPVDGSGSWVNIPGIKLQHISASGADDVFGIDPKDNVFRCKKPCFGSFEQMSGQLRQCDATVNGLFGVNAVQNIYRHDIPLY